MNLLPEGVLISQSLINSAMPELKESQLGKILPAIIKMFGWGRPLEGY